MALIDSGSKSSRLLASRRYTHDTLSTAQESFTNVLDLGSGEVYTQAAKIPSSGLPHSSSADIGAYYQVGGENITRYWYRQKLTKSNLNNETWFFLNPTGSDSGVGAQLIDSNQVTNFISPKYSDASLATSTTEDSTPGYLAVLYKSSAVSHSLQTGSLGSGDIVSTNDYTFDYKTGIIQFMNSGVDPTDSEYLYITAYQYVGTTLETGLELDGSVSGSSTSTGSFGNIFIPDNGKIEIGDSADLQLYHDGSNSYIKDNGTGNLFYRGGTQTFQNAAGSKTMMVLNAANSVDLHFNNNKKLETTNVGVTITGSLYVSGSVGGNAGAISASGDIVADGDIIAYNASDKNLKDNIQVIKGSLDKIGDIRGVEFDWNEKSPGWARERGHDVGVIAQEVQKVVPEIVTERANGYLGVDYKRLVPLLIESIKELKEEVEDLKKKVN